MCFDKLFRYHTSLVVFNYFSVNVLHNDIGLLFNHLCFNFNFIQPGVYYSTVQDPTKQGDMSAAGWAADWANASTDIPDLFLKDG